VLFFWPAQVSAHLAAFNLRPAADRLYGTSLVQLASVKIDDLSSLASRCGNLLADLFATMNAIPNVHSSDSSSTGQRV
jgi:hypothetical protein